MRLRFTIRDLLWLTLVAAMALLVYASSALAEDVPRLTFATKRFGGVQIMSIGIDGSNPLQITHESEEATQPRWSPDGSKLVYLVGPRLQGKIKVCDADGGNAHLLLDGEGPQRSPCWSPDAKQVAFAMQAAATGNYHIFVVNGDGSDLKNLTSTLRYAACPAWSPDGTKIACSSTRPSGRLGLFLMNADGSDVVDLAARDMDGWVYPCWSHDGKQIAYGFAEGNEKCQLRQINVDGSGDAPLVEGPESCSFAAWSPDGRYLAYVSGPVSDAADLSIYDVLTGERRVALPAEVFERPYRDGPPSWVPVRP
jgi:TolB protein